MKNFSFAFAFYIIICYFLYKEILKIQCLIKLSKSIFLKNLSVRFVDYIIFFSFPNLFYVFKTSTAIFSCSATAMKIVNFRLYVHKLMKRGVLTKLFFRKVHIILNISIYYDFFHISHSLEVMNKYRLLPKPVFSA